MRVARILAAWLVLGMIGSTVYAQDEPVVIGVQNKLPTFGYTPPTGAFTLLGQYSRDESSGGVSGGTETTDLRFEERIALDTSAYLIHPNFLYMPLHGEFGLIQEDFSSDETSDRSNSLLYLWDVQAQFLKEQPLTLSLYTNRTENIVDRAFDQSFRNIYTVYGGLVNLRQNKIPTILRVYRQEQRQETVGGVEDYTLNDNVLELHTETDPAPNQNLMFDYRLDQSDQQSGSGVSDNSLAQSASLGHLLSFGPGNVHTLNSTAIYSDTTGNFANRRFHVDELLRLRHSLTLETEYQYLFDQQNTPNVDQRSQRATARLRHQLYQSLHTNVLLGASQLDTEGDSQSQDFFGSLNFQYDKNVPYGTLHGVLDLGYTIRKTSQSTNPISVIDQPFFFAGFQPIVIPGQTIDPTSIHITDIVGLIYVEGVDYTVTPQADGVRIDRIIGGAIPSDSTVLIDYVLLPVPDTQIDTAGAGLTLRYDILKGPLNGLSPYFRVGVTDQSVSGGGGLIKPNSINAYAIGADYRIWSLILTGEYEIFDSTLVPYNALKFIARLNHRISGSTALSGYASYVQTDYTDTSQETTTIDGNVSLTHLLTPELLVSGGVSWVLLDDSIGGQTQALQEQFDIRWRHRQVEVFAKLRNSNRNTDTGDTDFQFFELGIRRDF